MILPHDDWYNRYGPEISEVLAEAFEQAAVGVHPGMSPAEAHRQATKFARAHAGELLKPDGAMSMAKVTQKRVKKLVANTIEQGQSLGQLKKTLVGDVGFSKNRAALTARTETAISHGQGSKAAAKLSGRNMKRWVTQGVTCDICRDNEADGDIEADESFSRGHDTIPGHPNCECNVRYFHGAAKKPKPPKPPTEVSDPRGTLLTDKGRLIYNSPEKKAKRINAATRKKLGQMPEGQELLDAVDHYAQTMVGTGRVRDMATHILEGKPLFDAEYADRARILLNVIKKQSVQTERVYRGLNFKSLGGQKDFIAQHTVGKTVDIPIGSASYSRGHARQFLPNVRQLTENPKLGGVQYVVESHQGLPISSASSTIWEHEVILSGRFEVVAIEKVPQFADLPYLMTRITLKQTDVLTIPAAA